jgi:ClpP class serine protease
VKKIKKPNKSSKKNPKDDEKDENDESDTRKLTEETLMKYADGRIFTGQQAYEIGLVDELGDLYEAKKIAIKLAKKRFKNVRDTIDVEIYDKPQTLSEMLLEMKHTVMPKSIINNSVPLSVQYPNQPLWVME